MRTWHQLLLNIPSRNRIFRVANCDRSHVVREAAWNQPRAPHLICLNCKKSQLLSIPALGQPMRAREVRCSTAASEGSE